MTRTELQDAIEAILIAHYADQEISMGGWVLAIGEIDLDAPARTGVNIVSPDHQSGLVSAGIIRSLEDITRGGWGDEE